MFVQSTVRILGDNKLPDMTFFPGVRRVYTGFGVLFTTGNKNSEAAAKI
jgi:hypothetical protein